MSTDIARIRILAVDDHPIVREGIAALIAIQPDMIMVGEASDGREAIQQFRTHRRERCRCAADAETGSCADCRLRP